MEIVVVTGMQKCTTWVNTPVCTSFVGSCFPRTLWIFGTPFSGLVWIWCHFTSVQAASSAGNLKGQSARSFFCNDTFTIFASQHENWNAWLCPVCCSRIEVRSLVPHCCRANIGHDGHAWAFQVVMLSVPLLLCYIMYANEKNNRIIETETIPLQTLLWWDASCCTQWLLLPRLLRCAESWSKMGIVLSAPAQQYLWDFDLLRRKRRVVRSQVEPQWFPGF